MGRGVVSENYCCVSVSGIPVLDCCSTLLLILLIFVCAMEGVMLSLSLSPTFRGVVCVCVCVGVISERKIVIICVGR